MWAQRSGRKTITRKCDNVKRRTDGMDVRLRDRGIHRKAAACRRRSLHLNDSSLRFRGFPPILSLVTFLVRSNYVLNYNGFFWKAPYGYYQMEWSDVEM